MSRWRLEPWRGRRPLVIGVDRQRAVWLPARDAAPVESTHRQLASTLGDLRHRLVDLVAAPDLAVHWMQATPGALAHFAELRQVAQVRCAHLFGGEPHDWRTACDWRLDRPFACAALPEAAAQAIEQPLVAQGAQVRWHTAWSLLCARAPHLFPDDGWSALRSPLHLQLWECRGGHIHQVATLPVSPHEGLDSLEGRARQHMLLSSAAQGQEIFQRLRWLDLAQSGCWPQGALEPVAWPPLASPYPPHEAGMAWVLGWQLQARS